MQDESIGRHGGGEGQKGGGDVSERLEIGGVVREGVGENSRVSAVGAVWG